MDLENRLSIKLNQYFGAHVKLFFIYKNLFYASFIIIATKEDKVYEFEINLKTLLEFDKNNKTFIESKILNELCFKKVIDFKNSGLHVNARTVDGKVYCWGRNNCGLLGNGMNDYNIEYKPELNEYLSNEKIIDICCGISHTLVLTDCGEVYAWGHNSEGQIGNERSGQNECQLLPIKVNGFNNEKVIMISCGL
jgi:alpha-tubulin suppressor-like RCC1 family protein